MSERRDKSKKVSKSKDAKDKTSAEIEQQNLEIRSQKILAIGGFACFGLLIGFLWGANHMVADVVNANPLCQASQVGCLVATNTADWGLGCITGLIGSVVGGGFGLSLFLARR